MEAVDLLPSRWSRIFFRIYFHFCSVFVGSLRIRWSHIKWRFRRMLLLLLLLNILQWLLLMFIFHFMIYIFIWELNLWVLTSLILSYLRFGSKRELWRVSTDRSSFCPCSLELPYLLVVSVQLILNLSLFLQATSIVVSSAVVFMATSPRQVPLTALPASGY